MSTTWLRRFWPKPRAAGAMTTIRSAVTDSTCASTPSKLEGLAPKPKKTWTGDWKPWPMIDTRLPPSLVPEAGETENTCGWTVPPPPSA